MSPDKTSEIIIWNDFRRGSEKNLYALYSRYYNDLFRYGLAITNDSDLVKEYINRLFLDLWRKRSVLPEVDNPRAYIITCYKNKIIYRKEKAGNIKISSHNFFDSTAFSETSYEETMIELQEYQQLKQHVNQILKALTTRQKELITLRFIEELSYEEIASRLNISVRTVYNSIHESLKLLKKN